MIGRTHWVFPAAVGDARRGNALVMTILLLPVLLAVVAFAVDYGRIQLAKSELTDAADAAARYAVTGLGDATALSRAQSAGGSNTALGSAVALEAGDVETGVWNATTRTFSAGAASPNAVRVTARRAAARGNAVDMAFASAIGIPSVDVSATAIAVAGGTASDKRLIALWRFNEGSGDTVYDVGGVGDPADLTIADTSRVTWLAGGGLRINSAVAIRSAVTNSKIRDMLGSNDALTVSIRWRPVNLSQTGTILAFGESSASRGFMMGTQSATRGMIAGLRTATSTASGEPLTTPTSGNHVAIAGSTYSTVITYDANEPAALRLAGRRNSDNACRYRTSTQTGNLDAWSPLAVLSVMNDADGTNQVLGDVFEIAIWNYKISSSDVDNVMRNDYTVIVPPGVTSGTSIVSVMEAGSP